MSDLQKFKVVEQNGNYFIENATQVIAKCYKKRHADMIADALNTRITENRPMPEIEGGQK